MYQDSRNRVATSGTEDFENLGFSLDDLDCLISPQISSRNLSKSNSTNFVDPTNVSTTKAAVAEQVQSTTINSEFEGTVGSQPTKQSESSYESAIDNDGKRITIKRKSHFTFEGFDAQPGMASAVDFTPGAPGPHAVIPNTVSDASTAVNYFLNTPQLSPQSSADDEGAEDEEFNKFLDEYLPLDGDAELFRFDSGRSAGSIKLEQSDVSASSGTAPSFPDNMLNIKQQYDHKVNNMITNSFTTFNLGPQFADSNYKKVPPMSNGVGGFDATAAAAAGYFVGPHGNQPPFPKAMSPRSMEMQHGMQQMMPQGIQQGMMSAASADSITIHSPAAPMSAGTGSDTHVGSGVAVVSPPNRKEGKATKTPKGHRKKTSSVGSVDSSTLAENTSVGGSPGKAADAADGGESGTVRAANSLAAISRRFVEFYGHPGSIAFIAGEDGSCADPPDSPLSYSRVDGAAESLVVHVRRIYELIKILETISLVSFSNLQLSGGKKGKFCWQGTKDFITTLGRIQEGAIIKYPDIALKAGLVEAAYSNKSFTSTEEQQRRMQFSKSADSPLDTSFDKVGASEAITTFAGGAGSLGEPIVDDSSYLDDQEEVILTLDRKASFGGSGLNSGSSATLNESTTSPGASCESSSPSRQRLGSDISLLSGGSPMQGVSENIQMGDDRKTADVPTATATAGAGAGAGTGAGTSATVTFVYPTAPVGGAPNLPAPAKSAPKYILDDQGKRKKCNTPKFPPPTRLGENGVKDKKGASPNPEDQFKVENICTNFLQLFLAGVDFVSMNHIIQMLIPADSPDQQLNDYNKKNATKIRRIYDVANVFCSLNIIKKISHEHRSDIKIPAGRSENLRVLVWSSHSVKKIKDHYAAVQARAATGPVPGIAEKSGGSKF